ncbi:MAG TPA: aspartate--tRNA ligase, partial [Nocardioidaceae bacterium]|nr:aspartate--tRNA ligase [Nocardioidaceae bacterium]
MIRTHDAGSLRLDQVDEVVTLAGWIARRRDHGGVAFIDLRDTSGVAQVVIRDEAVAHPLRQEFCLRVVGQVARRPEGNANPNLPTGEIEVIASEVDVLSESSPPPFPIEEHHTTPVGEETRVKYRYLDLRRTEMAHNIRLRSQVTRAIRDVMDSHDFVDVETPYLTRSTPEGARDFLVPVRLQPGSWYALPQSPQLFKQLLMVAGFERYYQIARCFRDEDFRADRQPEFTQLDVEMSFCTPDDVQALIEQLIVKLWREVLDVEVPLPIPRMTYDEAMRRYGIDRPDLRFELELVDFTEYFADTPFRIFRGPGSSP